jgi:transaldolase
MSKNIKIKIFADGADLESISKYNNNPLISGFTTNPTLMNKAGITNYKKFAIDALSIVKDKPISFEVFADDFDEMYDQAKKISSWGKNINVKIPITNTKGFSSSKLIRSLVSEDIKLNITAIMTLNQVEEVAKVLNPDVDSIISIFCGRIADTGIDPIPFCFESKKILNDTKASLLWASPREVLNVIQAEQSGCDIITLTDGLLQKLNSFGKSLDEFSLETVKMFYNDALNSGFQI